MEDILSSLRRIVFFVTFAMVTFPVALNAQHSMAPAPVPAQIDSAQKVLISNAGGGEGFETVIEQMVFPWRARAPV